MRLVALLVGALLLVGGCTSSDSDPKPTATTSAAPSTDATPTDAEVAAADQSVVAAIKAGNTTALREALRKAGALAGRQAAAEKSTSPLRLDKRVIRAYRVAGWWAAQYAQDPDFSRIFSAGRLESYEKLGLSSAALEDLNMLNFRIENDWDDAAGERLSFNDTYDAAFDEALPDQ